MISIGAPMRREDIAASHPHATLLRERLPEVCADLDLDQVFRERQNFDPVGHCSRPDMPSLRLDRSRQHVLGRDS